MPTKSANTVTFKRARTEWYDDPVSVGKRVHEARLAVGLTQRELSWPGCSGAYLSRIERGERVPSLQVMRELATRLRVSVNYLAYGREEMDQAVADCVRAVEAAVSEDGTKVEIASAYRALSRAADKAATKAITG